MASQMLIGLATLTLHAQPLGMCSLPTTVQLAGPASDNLWSLYPLLSLSIAGQHIAWLRTFFAELGHPQQLPTDLGNDNMAAIILSKDPQFRARTKHIQCKYHFVRDDLIAKGEAIVRYVPTDDMVADIFTKALPHDKHWKFVTAMGLRLCSSGSVKICRP